MIRAMVIGLVGLALAACDQDLPKAGGSPATARPDRSATAAPLQPREVTAVRHAVIRLPAPPPQPAAAFRFEGSADPVAAALTAGPIFQIGWPSAQADKVALWTHFRKHGRARAVRIDPQAGQVIGAADDRPLSSADYSPIVRVVDGTMAAILAPSLTGGRVAYVVGRDYDRWFFGAIESAARLRIADMRDVVGELRARPTPLLRILRLNGRDVQIDIAL